jgi:hypothetical protein
MFNNGRELLIVNRSEEVIVIFFDVVLRIDSDNAEVLNAERLGQEQD